MSLSSRVPDAVRQREVVHCRAGAHLSANNERNSGSRLCAAALERRSASGDTEPHSPCHQFTACNFRRSLAVRGHALHPKFLLQPKPTRPGSPQARSSPMPRRPRWPRPMRRSSSGLPTTGRQAQAGPARPPVRRRRQGGARAARALRPWRGRPRQDHADGPVLPAVQSSSTSAARISTNSWPMCMSASTTIASASRSGEIDGWRCDRADRACDLRRERGCSASTNSTSPTSPTR